MAFEIIQLWDRNGSKAYPNILDAFYPVGTVYQTTDGGFNPNTSWGGTWEQIKDRFLLSAGDTYLGGSAGGEATHTLTSNEMPSHEGHVLHGVGQAADYQTGGRYLPMGNTSVYGSGGRGWYVNAANEPMPASKSEGGGQAHNNMPPYIAVYVWKRTA